MKIYLVPCGAYKQSDMFFGDLFVTLVASIVVAMNKEEALGRILLDMKDKFPEKDKWIHLIGDIDEDSTEELKEVIEGL